MLRGHAMKLITAALVIAASISVFEPELRNPANGFADGFAAGLAK